MKKYLLVICSFLVSFSIYSQTSAKYLEGAVPEMNGKVVFQKIINVKSGLSAKSLYSLMDEWAKKNYTPAGDLKSRVLLANAEQYNIACQGETYQVFQRGALVLDRAKMSYQLILGVKDGECDVTVRNIRYDYPDEKEQVTAENMITDAVALNKNKDKLNRYYDKFRIHTVDSIHSLFNRIDVYLNGVNMQGAASVSPAQPIREEKQLESPVMAPETVAVQEETKPEVGTAPVQNPIPAQSAEMVGYRKIEADKIPGNIVKLLNEAMLITSGKEEQVNVMTASWGGLGRFWEKSVAFCFLSPTRYSVETMDKGETYTLSFYTEAYRDAVMYCGSVSGRNTDKIKGSGLTPIKTPSGSTAFAEAWMIFECKKIVAQPISADAVVEKDLPDRWTKNGLHKMYIGEILNVWVK